MLPDPDGAPPPFVNPPPPPAAYPPPIYPPVPSPGGYGAPHGYAAPRPNVYSAPPPTAPTPPYQLVPLVGKPTRVPQAIVAILAVLALVGVAAGVGSAMFEAGPQYPDRWDPRVAKIVEFVEQHRGHEFKHPVAIYFLSPKRYAEIAGGGPDQAPPTAEEKEYSRASVAEYRALGLMQGDPDLLAANEKLQDSGTLAFYSPEDDVVNVRGTKMTVGLRVTLAHELTHALQDQYFDLSPIADAATADGAGAARAVVEGDAVSVEDAYVDSLSEADRAAYEAESSGDSDQADEDLGDVPAVVQVLFGSYYAVGNAFVTFWQATQNGDAELSRIDSVLRQLPIGSYQLFVPDNYLNDSEPTLALADVPKEGEELFERTTLGVDLLFVMLAERIDPLEALHAVDGWTGDTAVAKFDESNRMCVVENVRFESSGPAEVFAVAANKWVAAMPSGANASATIVGDSRQTVTVTTCDAGKDADMKLTGRAGPALAYPVTRLQAAAGAISNGRDYDSAWCYGDAVVSHLTPEDMQAEERTPAIDAAIAAAEDACP